jgi:hypothetical protein
MSAHWCQSLELYGICCPASLPGWNGTAWFEEKWGYLGSLWSLRPYSHCLDILLGWSPYNARRPLRLGAAIRRQLTNAFTAGRPDREGLPILHLLRRMQAAVLPGQLGVASHQCFDRLSGDSHKNLPRVTQSEERADLEHAHGGGAGSLSRGVEAAGRQKVTL